MLHHIMLWKNTSVAIEIRPMKGALNAPNEQIDVEPGGWLYEDPTVKVDTNFAKLATGFFGSMNFITNRFSG